LNNLKIELQECKATRENESFNKKIQGLIDQLEASNRTKAKAVSIVLSIMTSEDFKPKLAELASTSDESVNELRTMLRNKLAPKSIPQTPTSTVSSMTIPKKQKKTIVSPSISATPVSESPKVIRGRRPSIKEEKNEDMSY
jgi:hypothetical protein